MKKYRLKKSVIEKVKKVIQKAKDFIEMLILSIGVATLLFTGMSCMIYSAKEYDKRMIQQEYNKKTDTSETYISQNK